jgi:sporulation protein YlmC with PRC-barrel domain
MSLILASAASGFAYAQEPAAKPDPNTAHPPENRMDAATPTMKAPEGAEELAPTNRVGETVPPMKATDSQTSTDTQKSADTTAQPAGGATLTVTEDAVKEWIGRPVYSSEGTKLGGIAALQRDPDNTVTELQADIGGFLGFGETRVRIPSDNIKEATDDSVVLTLTEAEAKSLPAVDTE